MAITLTSNNVFTGDTSKLPSTSAPMPPSAVSYADFVRGLYINAVNGITTRSLDPLTAVSLSRSSQAAYISASGALAYAANAVPRIDRHPHTLAVMGLRAEDSSKNYAAESLNFLSATWANAGVTVQSAGSWYTVTESSQSEYHSLTDGTTVLSATASNAVSVHAKPGTARYIQIYLPTGGAECYANYDLQSGGVTKLGSDMTDATVEPGYDGSWRVTAVDQPPLTGAIVISVIDDPASTAQPVYTGTGRTVSLSVFQVERSTFASSPITFGNMNRAADTLSLLPSLETGSADNFTVFASGTMPLIAHGGSGGNTLLSLYNATTKKFVSLGMGARTGSYAFKSVATNNIVGGTFNALKFTAPGFSAGAEYSLIVSVKNGEIRVYSGSTDAPELIISGATGFERVLPGRGLDSSVGTTGLWGGWLTKFVLYPSALTDSQMIAQYSALV